MRTGNIAKDTHKHAMLYIVLSLLYLLIHRLFKRAAAALVVRIAVPIMALTKKNVNKRQKEVEICYYFTITTIVFFSRVAHYKSCQRVEEGGT